MKSIAILALILTTTAGFSQINMEDSTVQVISYWSIGDKQSYSVSFQKIRINGKDTTTNETMTYDIDVTVVDSTENSYLVEWLYSNYETTSRNEMVKKITSLAENIKVIVETDELGIVNGVKNWEEVSRYMNASIAQASDAFRSKPELRQVFEQVAAMYSSKEAVESTAIQDVHQFHTFHGGRYTLGELIEVPVEAPNIFNPDRPLDTMLSLYLDEIDADMGNFIMRSSQEVDSEQLTVATYEYLAQMARRMGVEEPKRDDIGDLTNVTTTASRIHESGWLIYSIQTKTTEVPGAVNIEERIIEIK